MFTCRCTHVESKKMDFLFYDFSIIYYDFSKIQSKCKKKTKTPYCSKLACQIRFWTYMTHLNKFKDLTHLNKFKDLFTWFPKYMDLDETLGQVQGPRVDFTH